MASHLGLCRGDALRPQVLPVETTVDTNSAPYKAGKWAAALGLSMTIIAASRSVALKMFAAVGPREPLHVACGTNGTWLNGLGRNFFKMIVTRAKAAETARAPVLFPGAATATEGCSARLCATAAIHAAANGWGWPF
jgi:hypothetical protein